MKSLALLMSLVLAAAPGDATLTTVRELYLSAVHDAAAIPRGLAAVESARAHGNANPAVLSAYQGALITLRAKHGSWPPARLSHLREGLAILDQAVRDEPDQVEVRFLRLLSCYYLPGFLGRRGTVRADFAMLAVRLPSARGEYPKELYELMVGFVLEHGRPDPVRYQALRDAIAP
jgi:hypothetical protein